MLKEKAKEYREVNKDKISTKKKLDRITCECGCTSRGVYGFSSLMKQK
jgi:hypothetical protein